MPKVKQLDSTTRPFLKQSDLHPVSLLYLCFPPSPTPHKQDTIVARDSLVLGLSNAGGSCSVFSVSLGILPLFIKYYLFVPAVFVVVVVNAPRIRHTLVLDELRLTGRLISHTEGG